MRILRMPALLAILGLLTVVLVGDIATACRSRYRQTATYIFVETPSTSATIVVELPADALLFIDDKPTTSTGPTRRFESPPLEEGEYGYTLKAELNRGGTVFASTKMITFRAGSTTAVNYLGQDWSDALPKLKDVPTLPESFFPSVEP